MYKKYFSYSMKGIPLELVEEHSYLGVSLHHGMSWVPHSNNVCNKANRLLGFLKRNLQRCSSDLKEMACKQLLIIITMSWILCCYLGPFSSQFDLLIRDDTT